MKFLHTPGTKLRTQTRLGERWARHALFAHESPHEKTTIYQPLPDRSSPGSTRTAPSAAHHDGGEKYATGVTTSKVLARNNIIIGTWNLGTLRIACKLEEQEYETTRYRWNILGLCEVRWKLFYDYHIENRFSKDF